MAFPVSILYTRALCDEVLDKLNLELRVFTVRDSVYDLRSDQSTERATARAVEIADLQAQIAELTPLVAALTTGSETRFKMEQTLTRATRRLEDLTVVSPTAATPVAAFLQAVDARQMAVQVPELQAAIAAVTAHRATLAA